MTDLRIHVPVAILVLHWLAFLIPASADEDDQRADVVEHVVFTAPSGAETSVDCRVLVEAVDGGVLIQDRTGVLWNVVPEKLKSRRRTGKPFESLTAEQIGPLLVSRFDESFRVIHTEHYVICTDASRHYGQWCGRLFERVYKAFFEHWSDDGVTLREPEFPLVAVVFSDRDRFAKHATADAGAASAAGLGYYSMRSNRITLFDLTRSNGNTTVRSAGDVTRRLSQVPFNVATVVHEATHQLAFNCGLHARYADNPVWLTEGMAMYFETADTRRASAVRSVGRVNRWRLKQLHGVLANGRPDDSLDMLVTTDDRFRNPEHAAAAYAESWALTWFLMRTRREQYVAYLNRLAAKPRLIWDSKTERRDDFRAAFGVDPQELDDEFTRYVRRHTR